MKKLSSVFLSVLLSMVIMLQGTQTVLAAPFEVYGRIEMNSADYYLDTDIDEFGNARIFPEKTTFSASDAVSGATTLAERFTLRADQGQNAVYAYSPERAQGYRDWANKITRITYLSYDWSELIRYVPSDMGYTEQEDGLALNTKSLDPGIYTVRIYSEGSETFVLNLEIQSPALTISINDGAESVYTYAKTSFKLSNLGFNWKTPVYEVVLNGVKLSTEQYSFVFNLLTLSENVLTKEGENTLTVKCYGYKDASLTFTAKPGNIPASREVMAISAATSSSGGGDVDGVSGATGTVPAFLVFNFDLLANAQLLKEHNLETEASKGVLKWWDEARKEVVRGYGSMDLYDWERYVASQLSFEDYVASKPMRATAADGLFWDMWEVKNVLENGKLGDPYDFYEQIAAPHPVVSITRANWQSGLTLAFADIPEEDISVDAWRAAMANVPFDAHIMVGSTGLRASEYEWTAEGELFFPKETLANRIMEGDTLTIRSSGYKTIKQKITFANGTYTPEPAANTFYVGDDVVIKGIPADLSSPEVRINGGEALFNGAGYGSSKYFTLKDGQINLYHKNFNEVGTYSVQIKSSNYATQTVKVKLEDGAGKPGYQVGPIANVVFDSLLEGYGTGLEKNVTINNTGNQPLTNLKAILSGGVDSKFTLAALDTTLVAGAGANLSITPKTGLEKGTYTETVTISADNMTPVTFTVTQIVGEEETPVTPEPGDGRPVLPSGQYYIDEDVVITDFNQTEPVVVEINANILDKANYTYKAGTLTLKINTFSKAGKYTVNVYMAGMPFLKTEKSIQIVAAPGADAHKYDIGTIANITFDQLTEGYAAGEQENVTLTNTGNQPLTNLKAALSGGVNSHFTLGAVDTTLAVDAGTDLFITPKTGLEKGTYRETVTISADNMTSVTFTVTQVVKEADAPVTPEPQPERPDLSAGQYYIDEDVVITGFSGTGTVVKINGEGISKTIEDNKLFTSNSDGSLILKKGVFTKAGTYTVNLNLMGFSDCGTKTVIIVAAP
ncbi:DUF1533 domain-containing protein [Aminipila butyrica]|uniref:DUF1533 domain-containing protein n=1 Tax=Aminipila butyrica TaxID=433296 RepID=A0A858BVH2_9FIRM|nr:hemoblobin-interacting domain-containing protein [Aminipila butyrica]QIB68764.1 DUF1533 domain-containing protein [Aminipila butyrica]